jgi:hypothetical protein
VGTGDLPAVPNGGSGYLNARAAQVINGGDSLHFLKSQGQKDERFFSHKNSFKNKLYTKQRGTP